MFNSSLSVAALFASMIVATPALAKTAVKQPVARSDEWNRHRAIEESISRMQLDDLIASIVDTDGKHPMKTQRASLVKSSRAS